MPSAALDTKLSEVLKYFMAKNLKDLRPFSDLGKKKTELKRSLEQITSREPFDAYTGLAILSLYENNFIKSTEYFKAAYEATNHDLNSSINYANNLFLDEQYQKAINIYLDIMEKYPNNPKLLIGIINSLERYYFIEESEKVLNLSKGIDSEVFNEQLDIINHAKEQLEKIKEIGLDIIFVRQFLNAVERVFFEKFTFTAALSRESIFDMSRKIMFYTISLPMISNDLSFMSELVADMNDSFQDRLIDIIKSYQIKNSQLLSKHLCIYFTVDVDKVVHNADAA